MSDVREVSKWHEYITEFNNFAATVSGEFKYWRGENGKEFIQVRLCYRPKDAAGVGPKEEENG